MHSILLCINHILLTHFSSDGQFFNDDHCCYFITQCIIYSNPVTIVATINSTAVNILEHMSLYKLVLVHTDP